VTGKHPVKGGHYYVMLDGVSFTLLFNPPNFLEDILHIQITMFIG